MQAPLGCEGYTGPDCANARGGNFSNATSSTWKDKGVYYIYVEQNLGYYDEGDYGFDTGTSGTVDNPMNTD